MSHSNNNNYNIPIAYRKMENLHIVFWIFKDIGWCMGFAWLGIFMIIPTMIISIVIAWRTRNIVSELCHNLAITVWISANSFWMCSEFFEIDNQMVLGTTVKHLAMIPFVTGVVILAYYYLWYTPRHQKEPLTL